MKLFNQNINTGSKSSSSKILKFTRNLLNDYNKLHGNHLNQKYPGYWDTQIKYPESFVTIENWCLETVVWQNYNTLVDCMTTEKRSNIFLGNLTYVIVLHTYLCTSANELYA